MDPNHIRVRNNCQQVPSVCASKWLPFVNTPGDSNRGQANLPLECKYSSTSQQQQQQQQKSVVQHSCGAMQESCKVSTKYAFHGPAVPCFQPIVVAKCSESMDGVKLGQTSSSSLLTTVDSNSELAERSSSNGAIIMAEPSGVTQSENWQTQLKNVRERNAAMFMNKLMSDVQFVLTSKNSPEKTITIPAHKYVLATCSSVFYAMFYGSLAEQKNEIEIPDVEPSAFVATLRYIYCDQVQIEPESVLSVLYCAKKYLLPHLSKMCVKYLESNLSAQNACLLLSQSRLFDENELIQKCFEVIDAQAEIALNSDGFTQVELDTLRCILSRETLNAKEITIYEATLRWAKAECVRRQEDITPDRLRAILADTLFLLRLPTMSLEEFANGPAQCDILTVKEVNDIFLHFTASSKPKLCFPSKPRRGLILQKCHRFLASAYRSNQWRYRGRCDSIQFSVDKRIFVQGYGLYGSSNGANEYKVKMELKRVDQVLATKHTRFFSDGSSNTFAVLFDSPIQIEPETFYIASVTLDGTELSYFGQDGLSEVSVDSRVNFQFQCSSESTNGTGVQGGQIPEILFYGSTNNKKES